MPKLDNKTDSVVENVTSNNTTFKKADAFINLRLITKSGVKQNCGALAIHKDSKDAGIKSLWSLIENDRMERLQEIFKGFEIRVEVVDHNKEKKELEVDDI